MNVAVLFSGGKDSTYALYWCVNQGWSVDSLISLKPSRDDSYMFHKPCIELTSLQAECMGFPYKAAVVSGVEEEEVDELQDVLRSLDIDGVVTGAVASEYQKTRIDTVCENLGLHSFAPLWHKSPLQLMRDILAAGFKFMFVGVAAEGLDEGWLGRIIEGEDLEKLVLLEEKFGVSVCGEGGEFESLVLDGPIFNKRIVFDDIVKHWDGQSGTLELVNPVASV